jgi:serine/threonine-protein kinase
MEMLMAHAYEPVPEFDSLLKGVPKDVEDVMRRCLEKDPAKRWPDAASLEKALAACACADEWTEECAEGWWRGQSSESTVSNLVSPATPQLAQSPVPAA